MDPIDMPGFNILRPRPANEDTILAISILARAWKRRKAVERKAHVALARAVREAKKAGHSYQQLADAVGMSVPTIQRMCQDP